MPSLQLNLKKISDERSSLSCTRADGSVTWSRVQAYFPRHDLGHYAVETALGLRQGFFGLIANGWELDDFAQKRAAARLPAEAIWAECAVGVTELLGASQPPPLAEWQDALAQSVAGQGLPPFRTVGEPEYARLHSLRATLLRQWAALPVGGTLTLEFALPD